MEEQYVFVKCKVVGNGRMCFTLQDIVDLVVVGMEYGEYKHKFSIFKEDTIPINYFDNKQEKINRKQEIMSYECVIVV